MNVRKSPAVLICAAAILLTGCKKEETALITPAPAVSSYNAGHTNTGGTVIVGETSRSDSYTNITDEEIIGDFETEAEPDGTGLSVIKYHGKDKKVSVPAMIKGNKVVRIGEYAFRGVDEIESLTIPGSVIEVDNRAFTDCRKLKRVIIAEGVRVINDYAFSDCINLVRVELPDTVREVGNGVFANCESVKVEYKGNTYTQENMKELYDVF